MQALVPVNGIGGTVPQESKILALGFHKGLHGPIVCYDELRDYQQDYWE